VEGARYCLADDVPHLEILQYPSYLPWANDLAHPEALKLSHPPSMMPALGLLFPQLWPPSLPVPRQHLKQLVCFRLHSVIGNGRATNCASPIPFGTLHYACGIVVSSAVIARWLFPRQGFQQSLDFGGVCLPDQARNSHYLEVQTEVYH
jgi:hypothetical protein